MWRAILLLSAVSLSQCQTMPNRVASVTSVCDKTSMTVHLEMAQPFKGLVFSKDFSRECRVQGMFQYILELCMIMIILYCIISKLVYNLIQ